MSDPRHAYLAHDGALAFAHRGGTDRHPENTMAAFSYAVDLGYRYLETDVHLTTDGALVAFHDPDLGRLSDRSGQISDMTLAEVEAVSVVDDEGELHSIPTLDEIFTSFPNARINIDPKTDESVDPLIRAIRDHGAVERVCIGSFYDSRIRRCRQELGASLCTSMGPIEMAWLRASSFGLPFPKISDASCAQIPLVFKGHKLLDARLLDKAHEQGLQVHVWTIDQEAEMHRLLDMGVDGLMTDEVGLLRDTLVARNQWAAIAPD